MSANQNAERLIFTGEKHRSSNQTLRTIIFYYWNLNVLDADWLLLILERLLHTAMTMNKYLYSYNNI